MGFEAKVSEEFKLFAQTSQQAFEEAAKSEHGASSGCDMPVGTRGIVVFSGANAGQTKPKVVNNQPQPAKPYVIMELQIVEPEAAKGRKYNKYFDLSDHPNYSKAQKLCDFYDYMEDAGMPKDVRVAGDLGKVFAWAGAETRSFPFEVVEGYGGRREIKPFIDVAAPAASATAAAMAAAQSQPGVKAGDAVIYAGKPFTAVSVNGESTKIKSAQTGNELEVPTSELKLM